MHIGIGVGIGISPPRRAARPSPQALLGAALHMFWDAEAPDSITLAGAAISAWADMMGGHAPAQAIEVARPLYSAAGFGGRPAIVFDGIDDCLVLASVPFDPEVAPIELWACIDQGPVSESPAFFLSGGSGGTGGSAGVLVTGGGARFFGYGGDLAIDGGMEASGRHVVRAVFGGSSVGISVDGGALTEVEALSTMGAGQLRIGADSEDVAGGFFKGAINALLVTAPLGPEAAGRLAAILKARAGIA